MGSWFSWFSFRFWLQEEKQVNAYFGLDMLIPANFTSLYIGLATKAQTEPSAVVIADFVSRIMSDPTKSTTWLHLLNSYFGNITGCKFPSNRHALEYFLCLYRQSKLTPKQSATLKTRRIFVFWNRANIPVGKKTSFF